MERLTYFGRLWPGEFYNPNSSPNRVHQAVRRLKKCLRAKRTHLDITEKRGFYFLLGRPACSIEVDITKPGRSSLEYSLSILRSVLPMRSFTVTEVSQLLKMPIWKARRWIVAATNEGHVRRHGNGRYTRYELVKPIENLKSA